MKSQYGYEGLIAAEVLLLPNEDKIIEALELASTGFRGSFDPIPTLNDLIKQRQAKRILGKSVEPFRNAALQRYENNEINESQLWNIVEKVVSSI
uniref:Uncharacterized protein n=1 Tax=viral metagenome TaxID=1070528 RepID=A0A6H2A5B2_9ZZZZ